MSLSKEEIDAFKRQFKQLKPGKSGNFLYCPKGGDGNPVLMINRRRIPTADIKALRKSAKEKRFIKGQVALSADKKEIVFTVKKKNARLEKHVKTFYGRFLPRLKKARFELHTAPEDGSEDVEVIDEGTDAPPGEFDALDADAIKDHLADLRQKLEATIAKRQGIEPTVIRLKSQAAEVRSSLTSSESERDKAKKAVDAESARLKAVLDEENRLRALLQEGEAQLSQRTLEEMEDVDTSDVDIDTLSEQQERADEAQRVADAAAAELREKEGRLKAIRDKIKARALEDARNGVTPNTSEIARQLAHEEAELLIELTGLRADLDDKRQEMILERARSESMLDAWSEAQEAHWDDILDTLEAGEGWEALQDADAELAESLEATDAVTAKMADLNRQREEAIGEADAARKALEEDRARVALLARLEAELRRRIKDASFFTNTDGMEKKLEEISRELAEKRSGLAALEERTEALEEDLEERVGELDDQLSELDDELDALWEQEQEARAARNKLVLSEEELERVDELEDAVEEAWDDADRAREAFDAAQKAEQEALAEVKEATEARKAYEEAHKLLTMAKLKQKQLAEIADRHRGIRQSKGKQLIDEARGDLPLAEEELKAAKAAFEAARKRLSDSEDAAEARVKDAEEATQARIAAQETLAQKEQVLAQAKQRLAEDDARVSGLLEDIAGDSQREALSALIEALPEDAPERVKVDDLKGQKDEAKQASSKAASALMAQEMAIQQLQDEVDALSEGIATGETDPMVLKEKLLALSAHRDRLLELQSKAEETASAHDALKHDLEQARLELAEAASESDDDDIRELAEAFADARQHAADAKSASARALARDTEAMHDLDRATDDLAEARRQKTAAALSADLQDFISDNTALIGRFHTLQEPDKDGNAGQTFDLMTGDGRKAARQALGKDAYTQILNLQAEMELKAAEMIRNGASFEELTQTFSRVPNGLRPPSYRAEVAAFAKLEQAFESIDQEKTEQDQDDRILELAREHMSLEDLKKEASPMLKKLGLTWKEFYGKFNAEWEKSGIKAVSGKLLKADGSDASKDVLKAISILGVATHSIGTLKGIADLGSHLATDENADPVKQKEHEDELMGKLSALFSSSVKLGRDASVLAVGANPAAAVLGTLHFSKELALHIIEVAVRRAKARWDGLLAQAAALSGSALAGAFEESLAREKRLLTELGVNIGLDSVRIAASISQAFPPAAVFGIAAQLGAWATSKVSQELFAYQDAKTAQKAKQLLEAARAGDDAAKTELFKHHPRYAKGLIAYMAYQEKDSFALTYTRSRGLADSDIEKSSMEIIARYLLKQAKQSENMPDLENFTEKWRSRLGTARTALTYAIPIVGQIKAAIDITNALLEISGKLDPAAVEKLKQTEVLTGEVLNDRAALQRVTGRTQGKLNQETDEEARGALQASLDALGKLSAEYDQLFRTAITRAAENLDQIKQLSETLDAYEGTNESSLTRKIRQELADARAWIVELRTAESRIVSHLARAAS